MLLRSAPRWIVWQGAHAKTVSQEKERDESVNSSPRASKGRRHISPPPITCHSGYYESEDDKVLKGSKVAQLLRTIIEMRKDHKKLRDQVAELSLELKSVKDDYDMLRHDLCSKVNTLAKAIGKDGT